MTTEPADAPTDGVAAFHHILEQVISEPLRRSRDELRQIVAEQKIGELTTDIKDVNRAVGSVAASLRQLEQDSGRRHAAAESAAQQTAQRLDDIADTLHTILSTVDQLAEGEHVKLSREIADRQAAFAAVARRWFLALAALQAGILVLLGFTFSTR